MAETDQEKTEAPTARRRSEARTDGNVAKSQDLTAAMVMLGAMAALYFMGQRLMEGMVLVMGALLAGPDGANPTRVDQILPTFLWTGYQLAWLLIPMLLCMSAVALAAAFSQVGFLLTTKPLEPKWSKLNPLKGLKNMVGMRAWVRFAMSVGKVLLIAGVGGFLIALDFDRILSIAGLAPLAALAASASLVWSLGMKLAILLLVLAILDYAYQRWQQEQDLRMTKQEVREEMKRMDGDPLVRQRRSRVARQSAMQRTAQAVPGADVVVANPTHFAVALKYDSATMKAPRVVAKGADFMALRIRQIAAASGVPIVERKEVARGLYQTVEVGQEVPPDMYAAVAEILAYVYRLSGQAQRRRSA